MSDPNGGGNKTVFRPSPLQGLQGGGQGQAPGGGYGQPPGGGYGQPPGAPPSWAPPGQPGAPPPADPGYGALPTMSRAQAPMPGGGAAIPPSRLSEDDVPPPARPRDVRNRMLTEAGPVLALAAGIRAGRVRMPMPRFHREASQAIAAFDRAVQPNYPEEMRQRARYALCATIDDIAQNLPNLGTDGAEWARRSLVISFFHENIGGDRFWQLVDDMLRAPADNRDLIELYHACLAAGFEGRFRVMPDGKRRLHEIMARLQGAMEHTRAVSPIELSPHWRGEDAPAGKVAFWSYIALGGAAALGLLLLVYIAFRLMLMSSGEAPADKLAAINPPGPVRLSRVAAPPPAPAPSQQAAQLSTFLAPEIAAQQVTIEQDPSTVRVRTTIGQLFKSGSDELEPGKADLFAKIGKAVQSQPGPITIEGHADSDKIASLAFPDNMALSQARADKVGGIIKGELTDPSRVTSKGMGDTVPIASNDTPDGKARNRRVEVIVPRQN